MQNMRRSSAAYLRRKSSAGLTQAKDLSKDLGQLRFSRAFQFSLKRTKKNKNDTENYNLENVSV